jgi:hypothetical protein
MSGPVLGAPQETVVRQIDLICAPQLKSAEKLTAAHNGGRGYPFNRSRSAVDTTESAGQAGTRLCRADSGGRALTCAAPVMWRPLTAVI